MSDAPPLAVSFPFPGGPSPFDSSVVNCSGAIVPSWISARAGGPREWAAPWLARQRNLGAEGTRQKLVNESI